jgi:hypothetical protein
MKYTKEQVSELIKNSQALSENKTETDFWLNKINEMNDEALEKLANVLIAETNQKNKIKEDEKNRGIEIDKKYLYDLKVFKSKTMPGILKEMEIGIKQNEDPEKLLNDLNNV